MMSGLPSCVSTTSYFAYCSRSSARRLRVGGPTQSLARISSIACCCVVSCVMLIVMNELESIYHESVSE